jgi:hypothetical protein
MCAARTLFSVIHFPLSVIKLAVRPAKVLRARVEVADERAVGLRFDAVKLDAVAIVDAVKIAKIFGDYKKAQPTVSTAFEYLCIWRGRIDRL